MASFTLKEIIKATDGYLFRQGKENYCTGVSTDTRTMMPGDLFIALKGDNFDGHCFLAEACHIGASAILISEEFEVKGIPSAVSVVLVENTKKALEDLAHFYRMKFDIPVVAITGSNGKTTTKDMIAALLSSKLNVCATRKNFNNEIGLSMTLLSMTPETEVCVVEMGMRGLGQIAELCRIASPTIGVITNVGNSHIGILGSQENIAKAKGELIDSLPDNGIAILNEDDPYVIKMGDDFKGNVIGYGINGNYTVHGKGIQYESKYTKYICTCFDEAFKVKLNVLGVHNVYNALTATAAARVLGIDVNRIQKTLSEFLTGDQRQFSTEIDGVIVIDDSYNANPLSMEMAFRAMRQVNGNRYFLVLGDMGELGAEEKQLHYKTGQTAARVGFDGMITVGPLSHYIAAGARDEGKDCVIECETCDTALCELKKIVHKGDVVLIKGSHYMHMEMIPEHWRNSLK